MDIKSNSEIWRLENPKVGLFLPLKKKRNSLVGEILPSKNHFFLTTNLTNLMHETYIWPITCHLDIRVQGNAPL